MAYSTNPNLPKARAVAMQLLVRDPWARKQIEQLRSWFLGGANIEQYKSRLVTLGTSKPNPKHINVAELRIPIFELNPWLFGYEVQLFQILHAEI